MPRHVNLDITLFSSSLSVSGVDGSHLIETFSSRVALDNVSGSIRGKSFSGPFEIRTASWSDAHRLEFETFSGSVDLHVPDSTQGTVEFDSFSGRFTSAFPVTFQEQPAEAFRRSTRLGRPGWQRPGQDLQRKSFDQSIARGPIPFLFKKQ